MVAGLQVTPAAVGDVDAWRVKFGPALRIRAWDDEYVVFNPLSGHTHVLDLVSGFIIDTLTLAPTSTGMLCERVAHWLELDPDAALIAKVQGLLAALADQGLIEPAP